MSVLVKNMTIPEDCRECRFMEYHLSTGKTWCTPADGLLAEDFKPIPFDGRPDWCPLAELPEKHGRLIDESIVLEMIRKSMGIKDLSFLYNAEKSVVNEIYHAPTVIEAEGEE